MVVTDFRCAFGAKKPMIGKTFRGARTGSPLCDVDGDRAVDFMDRGCAARGQ